MYEIVKEVTEILYVKRMSFVMGAFHVKDMRLIRRRASCICASFLIVTKYPKEAT